MAGECVETRLPVPETGEKPSTRHNDALGVDRAGVDVG